MHHITPKKSGNFIYTSCELQTSNLKAVSFSSDKVIPLKTAMANKSPVKIRKFDVNTKFNNVVITKNTVIESFDEPVDFECADFTGPVTVSDLIRYIPWATGHCNS